MPKPKELYVVTAKENLNKVIAKAKRNGQPFYIGVAREAGPSAVDAVRNRDSGGHHADQAVKDSYRRSLSRVNHTRLLKDRNVCNLEAELIKKHRNHPLCQNKKQGQDGCINANKGTVYVRTYSPGNSKTVHRPKKRGTAKGTKKCSKQGRL